MAEIKGGKEADIKICIPSSAVDPGSKYKAAVPRLVVNGLKLKYNPQNLDKENPFRSFSYTPATGIAPADWHILSKANLECAHIRIHELREEDNLLKCAESYQENHARAMIVINTTEDYTLIPELNYSLHTLDNFFVAILTNDDGMALLGCLKCKDSPEVYARLDALNSEAEFPGSNDAIEETKADLHEETEGINLITKSFNSSRAFKFKKEILRVMFKDHEMLPISMDQGRFVIIMSTLAQYEKMGKPNSTKVSKLIKKLSGHLEKVFESEFPFFFVLIHRLRLYRKYYECDELYPFVIQCIEMLNELDPNKLKKSLMLFLEKDDFDIMFGQEETNKSVFTVLANAFERFLPISIRHNPQSKSKVSKGELCIKLIWISVQLKCIEALRDKTKYKTDIWNLKVLQKSKKIVITDDVIRDFKQGLEFSALLNLSPEHEFTMNHLAQFLASSTEKHICRPLSHVSGIITGLKRFIKDDTELIGCLMMHLRAFYSELLESSNQALVKQFSVEKTVQGALDEGISFLDSMNDFWHKKKWNEGNSHDAFKHECCNWMLLLLRTFHINDASAPLLLKKFLEPKKGSILTDEYFHNFITNKILEKAKQSFPVLTIEVFFPLFKAYTIWPLSFLHDYLGQEFPSTIRICDDTWSKFLNTLLEPQRFQRDQSQNLAVGFLIKVADIYRTHKRAHIFILDLLQLNIPQMNIMVKSAVRRFSNFLIKYIRQNNLCFELMKKIQDIIKYIPHEKEEREFQSNILDLLEYELIPDLCSLHTEDKISTQYFKDLLKHAIKMLHQKSSWVECTSPRQKFCWGIITAACYKLPISNRSFYWVIKFQAINKQLAAVFRDYCDSQHFSGQKRLLAKEIPKEIEKCRWDNVKKYFQWIQAVQDNLLHWQEKFQNKKINYDEIVMYADCNEAIYAHAKAFCAETYVISSNQISRCKETFSLLFEKLNCYLLRYVSNHPEVNYCTLPELLLYYGVSLPAKLQETVQQKLIFPGNENKTAVSEKQQLQDIVFLSTAKDFNPGQRICLMTTNSFTLLDLHTTLEEIQAFLDPIADQIEMFIFFHLHKSKMFEKHLLKQLEEIVTTSSVKNTEGFLISPLSQNTQQYLALNEKDTVKGISISALHIALNRVKDLLVNVIKGTATYSDIVAGGEFDIESLNAMDEFTILSKSCELLKVNVDSRKGLDGVKCMIQLFQFTTHLSQINNACEQYRLEKCLKDEKMKRINLIMKEIESIETRNRLTPVEAKKKLETIQEALCLEQCNNFKCLDLFQAVSDSAAFYQFLKDKKFVGSKGQTRFHEQYQLITAQLQHEEYDENVLNQLRPAYQFIAPFLETHISLNELMNKVTKLDVTNGLKQLKTVNENITLIGLWFSRAEGDTIENVAKELHDILRTGVFKFQLSDDSFSICLFYKYHTVPFQKQNFITNESGLEGSSNISNVTKQKEQNQSLNAVRDVERKWTGEQIADFVIKMGFLDTKKENGDDIKKFLHLNSTANKLLVLYMTLFKMGHPCYQQDMNLPVLSCSNSSAEADAMVERIQQALNKWQNQLVALHREYTWLLFFSIPKALFLYSVLKKYSQTPSDQLLNNIVFEVSFLFKNNQVVRIKLRDVIQDTVEQTQAKMNVVTPMKYLGEFLHLVCGSETLQTFLCKKRSQCNSDGTSQPVQNTRPVDAYQLHYAPGYSQSQLISLITQLYEGVPECYKVFHCRPTTTQEEIQLFIERIKHHPMTYLVLLVNELPFSLQELLITLLKQGETPNDPKNENSLIVYFIETLPSMLREVPWIKYLEHKNNDASLAMDEAGHLCRQVINHSGDFSCIQLVYGHAGNGKTYYIKQQLLKHGDYTRPNSLTIVVNEAFTILNAIKQLRQLQDDAAKYAVFFNFTLMTYSDLQCETEKSDTNDLLITIGWFFYHLLVLGYVEDPDTGTSFRFPGGQEWAIYIEVPSLDHYHSPEESLQRFNEKFPILRILGSNKLIDSDTTITVDKDVQMVCKYLKAYKIGGDKGIDRLSQRKQKGFWLFKKSRPLSLVKFSEDSDLPEEECHQLLEEYMPISEHTQKTKITQKLFIRYMVRRCAFLDNLYAFNHNIGVGEIIIDSSSQQGTKPTDTRNLGSTLMQTMIEEANNFCDPNMKNKWAGKSYQQLIYDFCDGGGSFGLFSVKSESMPKDRENKYRKIGFKIYNSSQMQKRETLDQLLARALGLPSGKRLSVIDEYKYVLTPDYAVKMLNIHERYICGMPVIIKGETGVGKTALVDMLSRLWNSALLYIWDKEKTAIIDTIRNLVGKKTNDSSEDYQTCIMVVKAITKGERVSVQHLKTLGQLNIKDSPKELLYVSIREQLLKMEKNPAIALLEVLSAETGQECSLTRLFEYTRKDGTLEATVNLLQAVLKARIRNTFHKLNVHAALTPCDIKDFFKPVIEQADFLKREYLDADESKKSKIKMPSVTVFLDEINTSSCPGLFKEIIIDKTLDGNAIPENVFIVAACNPHRGNSMATHADETWLGSTFYVKPLHPTLEYLMWDYGSLDEYQERDYIIAKMQMIHKDLPTINVINLTEAIVESQTLMRKYAQKQLIKQNMNPEEAELASNSCVSQRDIQRVFTFYQWFMCVFKKLNRHIQDDRSRRAVLASLGVVYYMRLNSEYRKEYEDELNEIVKNIDLPGKIQFSEAFKDELEYFCQSIELPPGIAKTQALKENLFATIVCTVTHTPLVIVGAPGSSKTLSFNLAIDNLKGPESKRILFRNTEIFKSLDPHFYQCSRQTTSKEIHTVFSHAINRQISHSKFSLPIYCVVFMDEAGLPEKSHESLKVLHYHLDKQEVSFVAITNHVLDAAKTNRAVSLFRPEVTEEDLEILAKGCLVNDLENPPVHLKQDLETIVQFCPAYSKLMDDPKLKDFLGLRDFIHFINYLRRRRTEGITPQLVIEALERNFNGIWWTDKDNIPVFLKICQSFIKKMSFPEEKNLIAYHSRSILEILKESLSDHPEGNRDENEVRYKLVIDPTEDNSLMHLLIAFDVLDRKKTRIYMCSDFTGDSQIQKINTIAGIRQSAIQGHTVVMNQTNDIHESFYDLFNQKFRKINDPDPTRGPHYYTNIAIGAHTKPCRVHPDFSCVVVVKQTEIDATPAPFLNRFEKYFISHEILLNTALNHLQPCVRIILETARSKVNEFIKTIGEDSSCFYGLKPQTLDSLLLSMLPPYDHTYTETAPVKDPITEDIRICLLHELLRALRNSAGFTIPVCSINELEMDADYLFPMLLDTDAVFVGVFKSLTVETAYDAVEEALHVLHTAPDSNIDKVAGREISQRACLVVSILQQWLIHHLCKNMMQLMTPEAICIHHEKIPTSLIENYLTNQHHFNLKKLIEHHLLALEASYSYSYHLFPNKLICFTRFSSIIHHLPNNYFTGLKENIDDEKKAHLAELIYDDLSQIQVYTVMSVQSQTAINETLTNFIKKSSLKLLLILINMQEATIEMVNHLRVMIEEAEAQSPPTSTSKLFVLLLHFPPAMFFDACYPTLFLRGWNHYYLDTIGHGSVLHHGQLDIEKWFEKCCFTGREFDEDNLVQACDHLLPEIIPVLVSRGTYGTRSTGSFTRVMNAGERSEKLRELLFDKGVGKKLCQMFRSCRHPSVMIECLKQVVRFTQSRESSLNIAETLQSKFRSLFTDFMVVMVSRISSECNLDILFSQENCYEVEEVFLLLLETMSPPKLSQIKMSARSLTHPKPQDYQYRFPFFNMVYKGMEELIEDSRKVQNKEKNLLEDYPEKDIPVVSLSERIYSKLESLTVSDDHYQEGDKKLPDPLLVAVKCIRTHPDQLWDRYFSDFIYHSLHLDMVASQLSKEIIHAIFSDLFQLSPLKRMVHLYTKYYKNVSLANISFFLHPFEKIWEISIGSLHTSVIKHSFPTGDLLQVISKTEYPYESLEKLGSFAISALFSVLVEAKDEGMDNNTLKIWYQTYKSVLSVAALRSSLYATSIPHTEQAKFNLMHTTFALLHIYPMVNNEVLIKGNTLFNNLLEKYFTSDLQLKDSLAMPTLNDCLQIAAKLVAHDEIGQTAQNLSHPLCEELFNHFLSPHRASYSTSDRDWFLRHVNSHNTLNTSCVAMYKLYLSLLLGCHSMNKEQEMCNSDPLKMYFSEARQNVADVLSALEDGGEPSPYIPAFYKDCPAISLNSENPLMQQPLCHLYFATLMEYLIAEPRKINSLVQLTVTISQLSVSKSVPLGVKVVLHIEKQAVIQCLLQELASIYSKEISQVEELAHITDELNDLLNNESTGGGPAGGHRLTLGMHLLHKLQSHGKFIELFTIEYSKIKNIQSICAFHEELSKDQTDSEPYHLPFMWHENDATVKKKLSKLYEQMKSVMLRIHDDKGSPGSIKKLLELDSKCSNKEMIQTFKMMLWFVTYYEFFIMEKRSKILCRTVVNENLNCCSNSEYFIQLISCFLSPERFIVKKESLSDEHKERTDQDGNDVDPVYDLLIYFSKNDQSDRDLCHCLANLVGTVLGCLPRSNHLWYHLFSPDELKDTYMTGFMYDTKISPESLFYDCGVELTPKGQYFYLDNIINATRGRYFLLWANFGTLCVSMLTQPNCQSKIHGVLISEWQPIRHYCVSQVKSLWRSLKNNLSLTDEERVILVNRCLMKLYETNMKSVGISCGKFETKEECTKYETLWHESVFIPAWEGLHKGYMGLCQNQIFANIRQLETFYPQYPSEEDFLNYTNGLKVDDNWRLLARFLMEKKQLEVGGQLLPILMELYLWLHTQLSDLVTLERASNELKIGQVIELASKRNPSLRKLYQTVKGLYNQYVGLMGGAKKSCAAVGRGNRIHIIQDDIPLIYYLSDSKKEDSGNDWLFAVIRDIAEVQNSFIHSMYAAADNVEKGEHQLARLLPQDYPCIHLDEANEHNCIVPKQKSQHGLSEYLQLVRARMHFTVAQHKEKVHPDGQSIKILPRPSLSFDLTRLQEDIVRHYLSGKPVIKDISNLRTVFKFKQKDSGPISTYFDATALRDNIPQEYQLPLETQVKHLLKCEFHLADYHTLSDIVIGLQTAVELLVKEIQAQEIITSNQTSILDQTLLKTNLYDFLLSQYKTKESKKFQVLEMIGMKSISSAQLRCLSSTKLPLLFSTLEFFVEWIKEGFYDFSSLPMALKVNLAEDDLTKLEQIPIEYRAEISKLMIELKELVELLLHTEPYIVREINKIAQTPLIKLIGTLHEISNLDHLLSLIPCTVLVHHYVEFRIALRKLTSMVVADMETSFQELNEKQWSEMVDDLWSRALPHLRNEGSYYFTSPTHSLSGFAFIDPTLLMSTTTGQYGFQGNNWEEEDKQEPESELGRELNRDSSAEGSLEKSQAQPVAIVKRKSIVDIEQEAEDWTPQMISQFLEICGMKKHAKTFLEEDIDGIQLLVATRTVYEELGVTNCVEYAQIAVLFKRKLMGVETIHCTVSDLIKANQQLSKHKKTLEEAGVDGDMLQFAEEKQFLEELLNSVGIHNDLDINRFRAALKRAATHPNIPAEGNSPFYGEQSLGFTPLLCN